MANNLGTDLDQFLSERGQRPVADLAWQGADSTDREENFEEIRIPAGQTGPSDGDGAGAGGEAL